MCVRPIEAPVRVRAQLANATLQPTGGTGNPADVDTTYLFRILRIRMVDDCRRRLAPAVRAARAARG
jgi:hypothetical protein